MMTKMMRGAVIAVVLSLGACVTTKPSPNYEQALRGGAAIHPSCPRIYSDFMSLNGVNDKTRNSPHEGIDIKVPEGTPVLAASDGLIVFSGDRGTSGEVVMSWDGADADGNSILTQYLHLSRRVAQTGETVKRGQVIGYSGKSGLNSMNVPHLHFETRATGDTTYRPVSRGGHGNAVSRDPKAYWLKDAGGYAERFDPKKTYAASNGRFVGYTFPLPCGAAAGKGTS